MDVYTFKINWHVWMNVHTWTRVYACVTRELNDCVALECNGLKAFFSWILYLLESCMIGVPSIFFKFSIHIHMWFLLLLLVSANRASVQACVCLCICVWVIKQKHVNRNSWLNKFKKKPYLHAWRDQKKEKHSYKSSISNEWVLSVCVWMSHTTRKWGMSLLWVIIILQILRPSRLLSTNYFQFMKKCVKQTKS